MKARMNPYTVAPDVMQAMIDFESRVAEFGLEPSLVELVKIRASQINGCAFCLNMHTRDARAKGETEQRIYLLDAWREAPHYTAKERAALAWTDALTLVSHSHVPDSVYDEARSALSEEELVKLTLLVCAINSWNRIAISMRSVPPLRIKA